MNAWSCIVVCTFAIVILSVIGSLYRSQHWTMVGSEEDPEPKDASAVAGSIFTAVIVYAVRDLRILHHRANELTMHL